MATFSRLPSSEVPTAQVDLPGQGDLSADELFERLRDGDEDAAGVLYRRYYAPLLRFAFSYVRSRAVAEEVVQEVFLSLWGRRATLAIHMSVNAYLYAAVRNRALRVAKHDAIIARSEHDVTSVGMGTIMGEPPRQQDARVEDDEFAAYVMRAIDALSERRRLALTLRWRHQLPYTDIAAIMGASVEAVTIQVARAREQIARAIQGYKNPK